MQRYHLICILVLAMTSCSDKSDKGSASNALGQDKRVNGTGAVEHISYGYLDGRPHINVWSIKSTPLSALADLNLFADFRPGMTFEDVIQRHGKPSETRKLENLTELRCYRGTNATLAVGREPLGSYHPTVKEKWTAWAFPGTGPLKLEAIAKQDVLDQLKLPAPPFCLVLRESTTFEGSLWITVASNGVTEVRWINNESARTARK
jgi:hypothetical protein